MSVQDQTENSPRRWSKTDQVLKVLGSNRISQNNRQFLRKLELYITDKDPPQVPVWIAPHSTTDTLEEPTQEVTDQALDPATVDPASVNTDPVDPTPDDR